MEEIRDKYNQACNKFVSQIKLDKDVIGIIVAGSLSYARIDRNSDIDIFLILKNECHYRERGNTWIDGVEIEYFKNPPKQIRSYFNKESNSPHTADMLACGNLVHCSSEEVQDLISEAKQIIDKKPPILNATEIELEKYFLDDQFKDLEDSVINDDRLASSIIRSKLINRCIDVFCKVHQIRRDKDKRLKEQINALDNSYIDSVSSALIEQWSEITKIGELRVLAEDLLGGRRSKEWILKSELDI